MRPSTADPSGRLWTIAAAAALAAALISLALPRSFWIMDEAFNYLVAEGVYRDPLDLPPAVAYPGSELLGANAESLRPLPHHYGWFSDGTLRSQYSPALGLLALPFRALAGPAGYRLLSAASLGALVLLAGGLLRKKGFSEGSAAALIIAGTPFLFYSQTFWGHLPAMALCAGAWAAYRRGSTILPALLLLAACLLREECLLLVPLLALPGQGRRIVARFAAPAAVALGFLALQRLLTGNWLGAHFSASGSEVALYGFVDTGLLARKLFVLRASLLSCLPSAGTAVSAIAGLALWALWAISRGDSRRSLVLTWTGAALSAAFSLIPLLSGVGLFSLLELKHPLVTFPALWAARRPSRGWIAPAAVLLATLLYMDPMHALDVAWGMRLLFPALLMLVLSSAGPGAGARAAIASGIAITAVSLAFLAVKRDRSADLVSAASSHGGAVIATSWELPGEFALLQDEGIPVVFADSTAEFAFALGALAPLDPVVVCPSDGAGMAIEVAGMAGVPLSPVAAVRFDPLLEAVVLGTAEPSDAHTGP
ncbi:MAG: hypothetical protein QUS11_07615 [Candidatus Fermentibacter sp.]|nr:hypothetical protein [Candidatus Fermentibacter sp.]